MGDGDMRLHLPGLTRRIRGGKVTWRCRVEGDVNRKITLPVAPDHPDFMDHYRAARAGERLAPKRTDAPERGTLGWLMGEYLDHLAREVAAGAASPLTLKERKSLAAYVLAQESSQARSKGREYRGLPMSIPDAELVAFKDRMSGTPGKARNVWKLLRAVYDFGQARGHCTTNPARAVARPAYTTKGGATPWTVADLEKYRKRHGPEGMAHLTLTLFMFTACRIGDAILLGRGHEERHAGVTWLAWQPGKKGSRFVRIPILPPLDRAIRAQKIVGPSYLLTSHGKPFQSPEGLRNRFAKWCAEAGIEGRSSHGIRKAAGHLLALHGATQYEIMSVHGHANASTSQVYTESVERMKLGQMAASKLAGMDW